KATKALAAVAGSVRTLVPIYRSTAMALRQPAQPPSWHNTDAGTPVSYGNSPASSPVEALSRPPTSGDDAASHAAGFCAAVLRAGPESQKQAACAALLVSSLGGVRAGFRFRQQFAFCVRLRNTPFFLGASWPPSVCEATFCAAHARAQFAQENAA